MNSGFQLRKYLAREVLGKTLRKPPAKERRGPVRDAAYLSVDPDATLHGLRHRGPERSSTHGT